MTGERIFNIEGKNPVEFFGRNNDNLNFIVKHFSNLKIVARGQEIKAYGTDDQLNKFEKFIHSLQIHFEKFGIIHERDLNMYIQDNGNNNPKEHRALDQDIIVHGRSGRLIRARTKNQKSMLSSIDDNDILFAIGPAGTGKTYTAVALAVKALKNKEVRRIILTRPAVEAGENLGFLPGDLQEKLDPYLQPLYDALRDMLPQDKLMNYLEDGTIEIAPLAFMRGRTLDHAFVILDEAQNTTQAQLKMFLTRMGSNAKFIITGDITQIDLPKNQKSGLQEAQYILKNIPGICFIELDAQDIVRHKLVSSIIYAYQTHENPKR